MKIVGLACRVAVLSLASLSLILAGCVERSLLIRSEPAGAEVIVNGEAIGTAPVEMAFETYGIFEVTLSLPRHQRLRTTVPAKPPWYEQIPIDFFAESVWPLTIEDRHEVTLSLKPVLSADDEGIDRREEELREQMEQGAE